MTRAATDGLFVEIGYFDPEDYFVYEAEAEATASAEFTISIQVTRIIQAEAAFTEAFTPTVTAEIFKNHTAVLDVAVSLESTAVKTVDPGGLLEFFANLNNAADRFRDNSSAQSAEFSIQTTPQVVNESAASLESVAALSCAAQTVTFIEFAASISAAATLVAEGIEYIARPNPFARPINLLAPTTFSTTAFEGTHSLSITDSSVASQTSNSLNISSNEDFLIEFQIRLSGFYTSSAGDEWLILTYGGSGNAGWRIAMPGDRDQIFFRFWDGTQLRFARESLNSGFQYSTTGWTRIRVTRVSGVITISTNNSDVAGRTTYTHTGAITGASPLNRLDFWSQSNSAILFDDFIYSRGTSTRTRPAPNATTVVEYGFNNTRNDNWIRTFSESFAFNLTATQTVTATKLVKSSAAFEASVAVTAVAGKPQSAQTDFTAVASQLTAAAKIGDFFVNADCAANFAITPDLFKEHSAAIASEFVQSTDAVKSVDAGSTVVVNSSMVTETQRTIFGFANLTAEFNSTAESLKIKSSTANTQCEFEFAGVAVKTATVSAETQAEFNTSAVNTRTRDNLVTLPSVASQLTAAAKIGDFFVNAMVQATLSVSPTVISAGSSTVNSASTVAATAVKTTEIVSTATLTTQLTASGITVLLGQSSLTTVANITASCVVIATTQAVLAASFAQTAQAVKTSGITCAISATAQINTVANTTQGFRSNLISVASATARAGKRVTASANLPSITSSLSVGRKLRIEQNVYLIPRENTMHSIERESRSHTIRSETRITSIEGI